MTSRSLTIACKELVVLARDRQAAALLFGMPAVFVLLLSLALEGVYGEKQGLQIDLLLENEDRGELARRVEEKLRASDFRLVTRPPGMTNAALFRGGTARAVVRIPDGFSRASEDYLRAAGAEPFGPNKIGWEASPALDAPYRWLIEARLATTCMSLFQEELARGQAELGHELEDLGTQMEDMSAQLEDMGKELEEAGAELEDMAAKLEEAGTLLASTGAELESTVAMLENARALLGGTPAEMRELALVAAAEEAVSAEAAAVRTRLAARGDLPEGVLLDEPALPELSFEPPPKREFTRPQRPTTDTAARAETVRLARDARRQGAEERPQAPAGTRIDTKIESDPELFTFAEERAESAGPRRVLPTPLQQTVPGWTLFAMFFLVVPLAQGLHRERGDGTLRRLLTLAVPRSSIVLGKLVPYVLVGVLQFAGMLAVGMFVVPLFSDLSLELGRDPLVLVPITLACALAAASYGLLVASLSRTPEQAAAFGATSVIILAVLGGVMVPHFVMPAVLQELALVSPLYWGHQAYLDAFLHGAGLAEVSRSLCVLVGFASVCLALAARRVARQS